MINNKVKFFKEQVNRFPDSEVTRFSLAKAYFDQAEYAKACPEFEKATLLKPDYCMAYLYLGKCLHILDRAQEARTALQKGLSLAHEQKHDPLVQEIEELLAELPEEHHPTREL